MYIIRRPGEEPDYYSSIRGIDFPRGTTATKTFGARWDDFSPVSSYRSPSDPAKIRFGRNKLRFDTWWEKHKDESKAVIRVMLNLDAIDALDIPDLDENGEAWKKAQREAKWVSNLPVYVGRRNMNEPWENPNRGITACGGRVKVWIYSDTFSDEKAQEMATALIKSVLGVLVEYERNYPNVFSNWHEESDREEGEGQYERQQ